MADLLCVIADPFCAVNVGKSERHKTKVIKNNLNPEWNEEFVYKYPPLPPTPHSQSTTSAFPEMTVHAYLSHLSVKRFRNPESRRGD